MKIQTKTIGYLFNINLNNKQNISRKLYGFKDSSYYSKYKYKRKGILNNYIKTTKSSFITTQEETTKVESFLKKYKIKYTYHIILLHKEEAKELNLKYQNNWDKVIKDIKGSKNLLLTIDF